MINYLINIIQNILTGWIANIWQVIHLIYITNIVTVKKKNSYWNKITWSDNRKSCNVKSSLHKPLWNSLISLPKGMANKFPSSGFHAGVHLTLECWNALLIGITLVHSFITDLFSILHIFTVPSQLDDTWIMYLISI